MKATKILLTIAIGLIFSNSIRAQSAGDIAFIGFNADGLDGFAFYVANDIPANTTVYFTDNDWDGTSLSSTEGTIAWSHSSIVSSGEVVVIEDYLTSSPSVSLGTATVSGSFNLSASNEAIYAFIGTDGSTPTTFLTALGNDDDANNGDYNLTGTGLIEGETALAIDGDEDVMVMLADLSSVCPGGTCVDNIYEAVNWSTQDGSGDQSGDGDAQGADFPNGLSNPETGTPLPVELVHFSVSNDRRGVALNWETASEIDNDFFLVQRSVDQGNTFVTIAKIIGAGTTNESRYYNYLDASAAAETNTYYRLKQVDFDGAYEYSPIVSISGNQSRRVELEIYPNPFVDHFTVTAIGQNGGKISVFDNRGSKVFSTDILSGLNAQVINFPSSMKAGTYHVIYQDNLLGISRMKIIKR